MVLNTIQQSSNGIMDDNEHHDHEDEELEEDANGSLSSFSEEDEVEDDDDDDGSLSYVSVEEFMEDIVNSSSSSSLGSSSSSNGPLFEMSSLFSQLPFKRGLSKHFEGKSQSFTSLSNVKSLEDLIKPERPFKKKLKPSKSYGWGLDRSLLSTKTSSKAIAKKSSARGSFSSLKNIKRHGFSRTRLSFPPQRLGGRGLETVG